MTEPKARLLGGPLRVLWEPVPGREIDVTEHVMVTRTLGPAALELDMDALHRIREREIDADRRERRATAIRGPLPPYTPPLPPVPPDARWR